MEKVVVSTFLGSVEKEYGTYTSAEAAALLRRRCVNGYRYAIPAWSVGGDYRRVWEVTEQSLGSNRPYPA